jgi:general stress protein 26
VAAAKEGAKTNGQERRPSTRRCDGNAKFKEQAMPTPKELERKFWDKLKSDRTMMLGLDGVEDGHARPMTAQVDEQTEGEHGPIWFFTATDNAIVQKLAGGDASYSDRAIATFADKGHDLFATVHGSLAIDTDRATIDRLWNKFVAAWYEGGKDDPKLRLLRLTPEKAEIWLNENSLFAGAKMLLGIDPKQDYKDKVATVRLN